MTARNFRGLVLEGCEGGRILARTRYYATYEDAFDAAARLYLRRLGHYPQCEILVVDRDGGEQFYNHDKRRPS